MKKSILIGVAALLLASHAAFPAEDPQNDEDLAKAVEKDIQDGKLDSAIANLLELNRRQPNSVQILNLLGAAYVRTKDYESALSTFEKARALDPSFFPPQFNIAETFFLQKKYPEALDRFRVLLQANPKSDLLMFKVILCNLFLDRMDEVEKIQARIRISGDSPGWYYSQAAIEMKQGSKSKAKQLVGTARFMYPGKTELYDQSFSELGWTIP